MDLTGILSISGYGGLFKLIKQTKTGFIVESLVDQKRMQAFASAKISTLEDIAIYTETGEVHLKEVLRKIFQHENEKPLSLSVKSSNQELKNFFEQILPDYDRERVYVSDIKKVVQWYNLLVENGLVDLEEDKTETVEEETEQKEETKKAEKKPSEKKVAKTGEPKAKKTASKKADKEE